MFSKLKLMIRLKLWCHVWFFYPKAPNVRLQRIFPEQLLMFFSLGSHKSTRFHHLKKTKPLNIWRIHHPDDLSVYPSTELVDPEKKPEWYRNRFSRRPEETRRVLWLLSSLRSRLWKRRECHFPGRFKCSDIFLCLSDRWLSICFFSPVQVNGFILAIAYIPHWVALHHMKWTHILFSARCIKWLW